MNGKKNGKNIKKPEQKKSEFKIQFDIKNIFIILFIVAFTLFSLRNVTKEMNPTTSNEVAVTTIIKDVKEKKIKKIEISDNKINATYTNNSTATAIKETGESFVKTLKDNGVNLDTVQITIKDTQAGATIINVLLNILPALFTVGLLLFLFRQAKGAQESVFSFGQSRAKRFVKGMSKITFKDVAGVDDAKKELEEIVDFLKNSSKYTKLGARTPKGVLLIGAAGTGKTLLAKAVAGEANVPFFSIAGSEFMEMLVGIGAARVRDLFLTAKKSSPSIIFIDEIDAIGRARSVGVMPSHDEREQTLNQILVEMDGFTPSELVVVIGATNRGDLLDPALLRPGRFDRRILVDYPDLEGRKEIIAIHSRGKPFEDSIDWAKVAKRTVGFSGADLENMLNEAAISAARETKTKITFENIEEAATKVKLGPEKKRLQSDMDKKLTAYHEAGHAVVSHFLPHTDPVHRISIVSRGMALGYTLIPPAKDKLHETQTNLMERITAMMGGRAAEEIAFKEITTGAANDFDQATALAKAMVVEYGMSSLGPVNLGPTHDVTEWGKSYWEQNTVSQEMLSKIDKEVKRILTDCYDKAKQILTEKQSLLEAVGNELIKIENMDEEQFEQIVGPKKSIKT